MSRIILSEPHVFYFHPDFHPERKGQIVQHGWRAIAEYRFNGFTGRAEAVLGLDKASTEASAIDLAYHHAVSQSLASLAH